MQIAEKLEVQYDGEQYDFVQVNDASVSDTYVAQSDEAPALLVKHLDERTEYDIYAPGDDEINRCAVRHVDSDHREVGTAYYLHSRPDAAVVAVEDVGALEDIETVLAKNGHTVEEIDQAYYYPENDSVEVWFRETTQTVDEEYPAMKHRHYRTYGRVEADDRGTHVKKEEDGYLSLSSLANLAERLYDDYEAPDDLVDEDDGGDPVLEERQRRNNIEGTYYPDQDTDDQLDDDDDADHYPDADGKPSNSP